MQCSDQVRPRRADERRQRLLETARALFIEHGFHGTGVAQLAAASGVKVGQIYRDFSSKEDIIAAIVEADVSAFLNEEELKAAVERGDRSALRTWIAGFFAPSTATAEDRLMPEIVAEAGRNPRMAQIFTEQEDRIRACLLAALGVLIGKTDAQRKEQAVGLADLILTLGIGFCNRRLFVPSESLALAAESAWSFVERELETLTASSP